MAVVSAFAFYASFFLLFLFVLLQKKKEEKSFVLGHFSEDQVSKNSFFVSFFGAAPPGR